MKWKFDFGELPCLTLTVYWRNINKIRRHLLRVLPKSCERGVWVSNKIFFFTPSNELLIKLLEFAICYNNVVYFCYVFFFQFHTLSQILCRVDRAILVLRHSVFRFLPNLQDIAYCVAELNATLPCYQSEEM